LVWWRRHEQQEFTKDDAVSVYLERGFKLCMETLSAADCPLSATEKLKAIKRARQHHARRLWSLAIRQRSLPVAWRLFRASGLGLSECLGGLGKYR
jgi:hypothetical protein